MKTIELVDEFFGEEGGKRRWRFRWETPVEVISHKIKGEWCEELELICADIETDFNELGDFTSLIGGNLVLGDFAVKQKAPRGVIVVFKPRNA